MIVDEGRERRERVDQGEIERESGWEDDERKEELEKWMKLG